MGFFDAIKKAMGGGEAPAETVKGPSRVLKDAGIDTSCLNCKIASDGSVTVSGTVESGATRDEIISVLEKTPSFSGVVNNINVGAPEPEPEVPDLVAAVEADAKASAEAATGEAASEERSRSMTEAASGIEGVCFCVSMMICLMTAIPSSGWPRARSMSVASSALSASLVLLCGS